ncbi:MAG: hypothetical protein R6U57_05465 [Anaerolineales bacterium]
MVSDTLIALCLGAVIAREERFLDILSELMYSVCRQRIDQKL